MDELQRGLEVAVRGQQADAIVRRVRKQLQQWGLTMPDVAPLVLDFGLGNFEQIGEVEFWIANEAAAGYCGKFLFVFGGQTCPSHMHREKLETFFVVKGSMKVSYRGEDRIMNAGDTLLIETGAYHSFTGIEATLLLEVSKPSILADNYFADPRIPIGGNYRV